MTKRERKNLKWLRRLAHAEEWARRIVTTSHSSWPPKLAQNTFFSISDRAPALAPERHHR
ncbi:MAG TPA: hypothetical protein VJI33_00655 [Candidatus Paceibacterota bacterium]